MPCEARPCSLGPRVWKPGKQWGQIDHGAISGRRSWHLSMLRLYMAHDVCKAGFGDIQSIHAILPRTTSLLHGQQRRERESGLEPHVASFLPPTTLHVFLHSTIPLYSMMHGSAYRWDIPAWGGVDAQQGYGGGGLRGLIIYPSPNRTTKRAGVR
jgi:hypothetical protein